MRLANDISRCINKDCPLKENCLRWLDKGKDLVWYADFKPENGKCENQIKLKK
ncbi:hypothetical protein CAPN008_21840 [Capnocytophaga canis]|nr:hypothetical protein CAPN008_21840 [Capnocytophaga canis]